MTISRSPRVLAFAAAVGAVGLSAAAQRAAAAAPRERPNIIVIVTDDQGWGDVGYHNGGVYSPRIDALANSGTRFSQHYVMPQCTPTRVAIMTGRYPSRFGPQAQAASNAPAFPVDTPTLGFVLRAAGYATYLVGKWHLGSSLAHGPQQFGFEHSYGSLAGAVGMYDHRYRDGEFCHTWQRDGELVDGHDNGVHATDLVVREAVRVIEQGRDRPFFLYLAFHAVHTPLDERGRFVDRPTQLDPDDPNRWLDESEIEWFHDPEGLIQSERDPEKRLLLAAVHHLDHAVGQVVDAVERSGQRERTLILFTSDNGPQVNWGGNAYPDDLKLTDFNQSIPMRGHKTHTYEGGIHVPGFAVWPGVIAAREEPAPVHVIDWLPTLAALVGGAVPDDTDGVDLGAILFGSADAVASARRDLQTRELYWVWNRTSNRRALRRGDWKIVRYDKAEPSDASAWQLFHLGRDPKEAHDVAADHPDVLADMHARYLAQRSRDRR